MQKPIVLKTKMREAFESVKLPTLSAPASGLMKDSTYSRVLGILRTKSGLIFRRKMWAVIKP